MERSYAKVRRQILTATHYFQLLGVHLHSTAGEVSIARRMLMRHVHPDVNNSPDAHQLAATVNAAADTLLMSRPDYIRSLNKKPCSACRGTGCVTKQRGFKAVTHTACAECHGAGVA